jgi:hypothetical protein
VNMPSVSVSPSAREPCSLNLLRAIVLDTISRSPYTCL